jgi:glycerol kinase
MTVLSVDAGTTGVTALLVDERAHVVARGYSAFPQHFPHDGWVEHDLGEIWQATLASVRTVLLAVAGDDSLVPTAIGITNQRETVCLWDRETLGAARTAIVWQDRRTASLCDRLRPVHDARVRHLTGLRLDPYFSATKLQWICENDPRVWGQVTSGRVAIGTVDSYLMARMSRGMVHATDATNASRTLLFDIHRGEWSAELCGLFGVPMDALPEIVPSFGELGRTDPSVFLGLDIPMSGVAGDQQAALVGQAGFDVGDAKCTYGTGSFLLANTGSIPVFSTGGLLTTVALGNPDGSLTYALEGSVFVTGAAVQWLRDGLGIIAKAEDTEALANSVSDSDGVVFVPALTGLGAPYWDPYARGAILGITRGTTRAHLARATLDAIAYSVHDIVDLVRDEGGIHLPRLAVDGGAAANSLLCQLQSNELQTPVERPLELQSTGLGAAFLAGLGSGVWSSMDVIKEARNIERTFQPQSYDSRGFRRWHSAVNRTAGWSAD